MRRGDRCETSARTRATGTRGGFARHSPLGVLQRGYAIAQDASGKLVRDAAAVNVGDEVNVRLAKGKLNTRVVTTEPDQ